MKTAEADNKYQRILLLFDRFLQSTENLSLYTHWLIREKKLRFALLESYAKEHAIEFAIYSDSEECIIAIESMPDIKGEHIEEKCYRIFTNQ